MNEEINEAVKKGLEYYNIFNSDNKFIRKSGSIVYKISVKGKQTYSFHLYENLNEEDITNAIESPLIVIEELRKNTDLLLPEPIKNCNDNLVTVFKINKKQYICTLQYWLEGEVLKNRKEEDARKIGCIIAKIHSYSIKNEKSMKLKLIKSSISWRVDEPLKRLEDELCNNKISKENYDLLSKAAFKAYNIISENGKQKDCWGIVHGDLNPTNFLTHNDSISILDFTCYFEYFVYDIALVMWRKFYQPSMTSDERYKLISEYKKVRKLTDKYDKLLEAAVISLVIWRYSLYKGLKQNENDLSILLAKFVENECKKFLSNKSFLYGNWTTGF